MHGWLISCHKANTVDNWYLFQVFSLLLLFLGVLMTNVPRHMQNLSSYIISSSHLGLSPITQQTILSFLSQTFVMDAGGLLLGFSSFLLLPSTLGSVGAVRESRVLLILVRKRSQVIFLNNKSLIEVLHTNNSTLGNGAYLPHSASCI